MQFLNAELNLSIKCYDNVKNWTLLVVLTHPAEEHTQMEALLCPSIPS